MLLSSLTLPCGSGAQARRLNILALDTSSDWCSAALLRGTLSTTREERAVQRHSELILPMIDQLLSESPLTLHDLDAIAFGAGPGSFTGLRIACGVAQGLAFGAGLPVVPVGTLEAMAEAVGEPRMLCALDARMDEIYVAAYEKAGAGWLCTVAPSLCPVSQAPALEGGGWTGCGSAFAVHGSALAERYGDRLRATRPEVFAHAAQIAALAAHAMAQGGGIDPGEAAPLYVRDKVAMTVAERRAAKERV
jgi:tRNA threonylcarbamoyladenosine biosynthesis protein TsaB